MLPSLVPGNIVLGVRFGLKPRPGRLIVIKHDGLEKIKRVSKSDNGLYYVTGDNPDHSTDSRHFGWIPASAVQAVIIWPR